MFVLLRIVLLILLVVLFFVPSLGVAIRNFSDEINRVDTDNLLYQHPDDFDLYELGTYDDSNADISLLPEVKLLSLGKQVKIPVEK